MLRYDILENMFSTYRHYKPIGCKMDKNIWLTYDKEADEYVISYVVSKYYTDEKGVQRKAGASERDKYTMGVLARVSKARITLFHPATEARASNAANAFFSYRMNVNYHSIEGVAQKGWTFHFNSPDLYYRYDKELPSQEVNCTIGVYFDMHVGMMKKDMVMKPLQPAYDRVWNKEAKNEFNRGLKAARRMLSLRDRLGAFSPDFMAKEFGKLDAKHKSVWAVQNDPKLMLSFITGIHDGQLESMLPALWWGWKKSTWGMPTSANIDWTEHFNRFVDSNREALRKQTGAVSYVLPDDPKQSPQGASTVEDASSGAAPEGEQQLQGLPVLVPA